MNKINLILISFIILLVGTGGGYFLAMSGSHDEAYLKETANMMKDDSKMMKEMYEMMTMGSKMMEEKGTKYDDNDLRTAGKTIIEKSAKLNEMSKEMMERGEKMMELMK